MIVPLTTSSDTEIAVAAAKLLSSAGKPYASDYIKALVHLGYVVVAVEEGDVIGVVTGMQLLSSDAEQMRERIEGLDISTEPVTLHLHDVVVAPAWRRRGVATELIRFLLHRANYGESTHRFTRALATSRIPTTDMTLGTSFRILQQLGFQEIGRFPAGYYRGSLGWRCPDCGEYCCCSGRLMLWERQNGSTASSQ